MTQSNKLQALLRLHTWIGLASGLVVSGTLIATSGTCVLAQIEPDNTLGNESSVVKPNANVNGRPVEQIEGGARRGGNLFHSFRSFNVNEGQGVYFSNPAGVENILTRVTGTNVSNIRGVLGVSGNANLFLINPNGIIFGANARLDVKGSFVASTANSISFADGTEFGTNTTQTELLLTVSVPTGLQVGANPGTIIVQGQPAPDRVDNPIDQLPPNLDRSLPFPPEVFVDAVSKEVQQQFEAIEIRGDGLQVRPGKTLALVGGNVQLQGGSLKAVGNESLPGGRIELVSVASNGEVSLTQTIDGFALGYENVPSFGKIDLSGQSLLNVSGAYSGDIRMRGNNVTMKDGSTILGTTLGNNEGREIYIRAQQLDLSDNSRIAALALKVGKSGDLTFDVDNLNVQNSLIATASISPNQASTGKISVRADTIKLIGTSSSDRLPGGILVISAGSGGSGNAAIQASELTVSDGAQIAVSTAGAGQGGTALIKTSNIRLSGQSANSFYPSGIFTASFGTGRAGNIDIVTQRLTLLEGANVAASTREGRGGNVKVNASDLVEIAGTSANRKFPSDISANTLSAAPAGGVEIRTERLIVRDGGKITAAAIGEQTTGAAGNLKIHSRLVSLDNQGQITTDTQTGESGNIQLLESQLLLLRRNSQITTNAQGRTTGGNINIDTQFLIAIPNENSNVRANAVEGRGGRVEIINTQGIFGIEERDFDTEFSDITASSERGVQGTVEIDNPNTDPSRTLVNLPVQPVETQVVQACQPGTNRFQSEFVVTGQGGLPPSPQEELGTRSTGIDWVSLNPNVAPESKPEETQENLPNFSSVEANDITTSKPIVEAQGMVVESNGKVILTAQTSANTPNNSWLLPHSCKGS